MGNGVNPFFAGGAITEPRYLMKTFRQCYARYDRLPYSFRSCLVAFGEQVLYEQSFKARQDLQQYGSNALLLYALEMYFDIEDIQTVATDSLTDGYNDKKCDLVYVDRGRGTAVIAQGYTAQDTKKPEAPANKASDLNIAAAWLLTRDISDLPDQIKSAAIELHDALKKGEIEKIQFWYVHNLPESDSVRQELETVQSSASSHLHRLVDEGVSLPNVEVIELGKNRLNDLYQSLTVPILVQDDFEIDVAESYFLLEEDWSALMTAIPARWLHTVFETHKDKLFSANIRGYLGSRKSDKNINNGIKDTAKEDSSHFWVYNNGLTILTHSISFTTEEKKLKVGGISIVNGAQTTGSIGSLPEPPDDNALIPARFVKCSNSRVVANIIRYNNSQNSIEAPDFRSGDAVQKRLRREFDEIPFATYTGGRRGGSEDAMPRRPASSLLPSGTVGQARAAFHGDTLIAYNKKSDIWKSGGLYSKYFSESTSARHIIFAFSLLRAVEKRKKDMQDLSKEKDDMKKNELNALRFFQNRGSTFLLVSAISTSLEIILDKPIPNPFLLYFKEQLSPDEAVVKWEPIVKRSSAFYEKLTPGLRGGLNSAERVKAAISDFTSFIDAARDANPELYSDFAKSVAC